ncbi:MAG: hypothetical protein B6242_02525 [Anaerolineaceae bacterium 4572_78]|nr:MAG: hypothetical protein B6242_02525 [Anaerolineaceae bacterium 4572_78]
MHLDTASLIAGFAYLYLTTVKAYGHAPSVEDTTTLLNRAILAADYLLRIQHANGLIDSPNYGHLPGIETTFAVQQLCTILEFGRPLAKDNEVWRDFLKRLGQFVYRAVKGLLTIHADTCPYKWVIASALVQAKSVFSDLNIEDVLKSYLDAKDDATHEESFIRYYTDFQDDVYNRSLLILNDYLGIPKFQEAVESNLNFNLYLFHANGTIETDWGNYKKENNHGHSNACIDAIENKRDNQNNVPLGLAVSYLHSAYLNPNPSFVGAAHALWNSRKSHGLSNLNWLCYILLRYGEPLSASESIPYNYAKYFPNNGLWRVRHGLLSASFFRGNVNLLKLQYGHAKLNNLHVKQYYFGREYFVGDIFTVEGDTATFRSKHLRSEDIKHLLSGDDYTSELIVQKVMGGFELRFRTLVHIEQVTIQIAFDFPEGGIWETENMCLQPQAGQVLFLKQGLATMRYKNDVIQIGPGAMAHHIYHMEGVDSSPHNVRVLFTFVTPVDHRFSIRVYRGL